MERKKNKIDLTKLDLFIQKSLDLYFYVDPWKKLYERTGRIHRNVISDKSTIPDLIIYNKKFNKSECFYEMNNSAYVEYPRIRFILRPKYRKEYNPTVTFGKEDEVYYIKGKNLYDNKDSSNDEYVGEQKENFDIEEMFQKENNSDLDKNIIKDLSPPKEDKKDIQNEYIKEDEDEDKEPEWANDNVEDFYNTKIEFKSIPKSLEDKIEEELGHEKNEIREVNLNKIEDKNNIDIDNFFRSNSESSINEIANQNNDGDNNSNKSNNSNNGNDMIFKDIKDFMKNEIKENEKENPDSTNENNDNGNSSLKDSEKSDVINENFNIFEKFNNIFIDDKNSNNSNNNNDHQNENKISDNFNNRNDQLFNANNKINNTENNNFNKIDFEEIKKNNLILQQQKAKQQYLKMLQMQNINNQFNNPNIINQSPYMYFNNPQLSNNILPYYNNPNMIQNNPNYGNINTINIHDKGNGLSPNINFYPFNNSIAGINMPNINTMHRGNQNLLNLSINSVNNINNNKDVYVNNLNRMIFNANNFNYNYLYQNNLNGKLDLYQNIFNNTNSFRSLNNNINNINSFNRSKNIFGQNWKNVENNSFSKLSNVNGSRVTSNLINEQLKPKIELKNEKDKEKEIVNPADYLENPTLILKKNLEKKNWLVINKEGNIVHNFNSEELFNFLEDKNKNDTSLDEFTINDFDTDVVFPAKFLYGNLKSFYSH